MYQTSVVVGVCFTVQLFKVAKLMCLSVRLIQCN